MSEGGTVMASRDRKELRARLRALRAAHHQLAREYAEVKIRVEQLAGRRYLAPGEELECKSMQRLKLHKKDALVRVTRELETIERALLDTNGPTS